MIFSHSERAVQPASNVEFSAQPSANGNVEFILREAGREIFRAEFEAEQAGLLASALLAGAYHARPQGTSQAADPIGTTAKLQLPIPTTEPFLEEPTLVGKAQSSLMPARPLLGSS